MYNIVYESERRRERVYNNIIMMYTLFKLIFDFNDHNDTRLRYPK